MIETMVKGKVSLFILQKKTGEKVVLGDVVLDLPKRQYEALRESYKRSKTKIMNDDDEIRHIRKMYVNSFTCLNRPQQEIYACYPEEIIKGLSFDELPQREVSDSKLELCDGIVADYDSDRDCFFIRVKCLGKKVDLELFALEEDDVAELENLKNTFKKFWEQRDQLLELSQKTIKDTIIPNINRKIELKKDKPAPKPKKIVISNVQQFPKPTYPDITVEEFEKDYRLTTITVSSGCDYKFGDVTLRFEKNESLSDDITVKYDFDIDRVNYDIKGFKHYDKIPN